MIEVVKNGKEKIYYTRCSKCGTEMNYRYDDMNIVKVGSCSDLEYYYIVCPVCGTHIPADLMTEEEYKAIKKNCGFPYGLYDVLPREPDAVNVNGGDRDWHTP